MPGDSAPLRDGPVRRDGQCCIAIGLLGIYTVLNVFGLTIG